MAVSAVGPSASGTRDESRYQAKVGMSALAPDSQYSPTGSRTARRTVDHGEYRRNTMRAHHPLRVSRVRRLGVANGRAKRSAASPLVASSETRRVIVRRSPRRPVDGPALSRMQVRVEDSGTLSDGGVIMQRPRFPDGCGPDPLRGTRRRGRRSPWDVRARTGGRRRG